MQKIQNQSLLPMVSNDSTFEFDPVALVSMLNPNQHFETAWKSYVQGQLLFMAGDIEEYKDLMTIAFKGLFSSADFRSLDADTQIKRQNMAVQLVILLGNMQELHDGINDSIVQSVEAQYSQILQN